MPQISHIKYSDVIEAWRFDADFFKPEYLKIDETIEKRNFNELKTLIWKWNIFSWPFWSSLKSESYTSSWVPFIRISDIQNIFINKDNLMYISEADSERLTSTTLNVWDIVLSKIWTIWRLSLITSDLWTVNISENNIWLKLQNLSNKEKKVLLLFLLSKYWQKQIIRQWSWNIQLKFNVLDIEGLKIPNIQLFNVDKLENFYDEILENQQQSRQLYQEAEDLLLTELGLKDHIFSHVLTFTTTKKEVDQAGRYDAEYFQPKYDEMIEKIEQYQGGWDFVENIFEYKKWFEPWTEAYVEEWKNFVRVSDFSKFWLEWTDKKISEEMFDELEDNYAPKKWEILFTKDWTIGISYLLKEDLEGILSWAFLRLQVKEAYQAYDKECLTLILNSIICSLQVERFSGWALIAHLKPSDFQKLKLPLIDPQIQQLISAKIQESFKLRNESKQLLEQAKKMVEDEIEKE